MSPRLAPETPATKPGGVRRGSIVTVDEKIHEDEARPNLDSATDLGCKHSGDWVDWVLLHAM